MRTVNEIQIEAKTVVEFSTDFSGLIFKDYLQFSTIKYAF